METHRYLKDHEVAGLNEVLTIRVCDAPGLGGASHHYKIDGPRAEFQCDIRFQNGPLKEAGANGISHEALLAVLIDRLRGFQAGPFACRENALALTKIEEALFWLHRRTKTRLDQGIEGTAQIDAQTSVGHFKSEVQKPQSTAVAALLERDAVEGFIRALPRGSLNESEFALIAGNIRNFARHLRELLP